MECWPIRHPHRRLDEDMKRRQAYRVGDDRKLEEEVSMIDDTIKIQNVLDRLG